MSRRAHILVPICILVLSAGSAAAQSGLPAWLKAAPPPGDYRSNQSVSLSLADSGELQYRFLGSLTDNFNRPAGNLELSALDGEERTFQIQVVRIAHGNRSAPVTIRYDIDKKAPPIPIPSLEPGTYIGSQTVIFPLQENATIHAWIDDGSDTAWDGHAITLAGPNAGSKTHTLYAYAVDRAGNISQLGRYSYVIAAPDNSARVFKIVSPAPGNWANSQLLYIESSGYAKITYTTDGTDPAEGTAYNGPVLLSGTGKIKLRVYAVPRESPSAPLKTEVSFSQTVGPGPINAAQGVYRDSLIVSPPSNTASAYRIVASPASQGDTVPFEKAISLAPIPGLVLPTILLIDAQSTDGTGTEGARVAPYRYCYVMDGETVPGPHILVDPVHSERGMPRVSISVPPYTEVHYTLDGSEPTDSSPIYDGPFYPSPLSEASRGDGAVSLVVTARSRSTQDARWGPVVRRALKFDEQAPPPPEPTWADDSSVENSGVALFSVAVPSGTRVRYSVDRGAGYEPSGAPSDAWSVLTGPSPHVMSVPEGMSEQVRLRFAAESASGVYSRVVELPYRTLDRSQPGKPTLSASPMPAAEGALSLEITAKAKTEVSITASPTNAPGITHGFVPYTGRVTLQGFSGLSTTYVVHAIAVDGGRISPETTESFVVDRRSPSATAKPEVIDTDLTSARAVLVSLRGPNENTQNPGESPDTKQVSLALPEGRTARYTLSTGDTIPPDPTPKDPLLAGSLRLPGKEGSVTVYRLKILPVLERDGTTSAGPVRSFRFVIDNQTPPTPILSGIHAQDIYDGPVALVLGKVAPDSKPYLLVQKIAPGTAPLPASDASVTSRLFQDANQYNAPMIVDSKGGDTGRWAIYYGARDAAGNRSPVGATIFETTSRTPGTPELLIQSGEAAAPSQLTPGVPVVITKDANIAAATPGTHYVLSPNGARYPAIDSGSAVPEGGIPIHVEAGTFKAYDLSIYTVAPSGEVGPVRYARIYADGRLPPKAPAPELIRVVAAGNPATRVSWQSEGGERIYYRIRTATETAGSEAFREYTAPFLVSQGGSPMLDYYLMSRTGEKSSVVATELFSPVQRAHVALKGIENGMAYAKPVTIADGNTKIDGAVLRYTIAQGSDTPPDPDPFSPALSNPLSFEAVPGQIVHYTIHLQYFSNVGRSAVASYSFSVDRSIPPPPAISGAQSGHYYQDPVQLSMRVESSQKTRIYYRILQSVQMAGNAPSTAPKAEFTEYAGAIPIQPQSGRIVDCAVDAYSVDQAGNRSRMSAPFHVFFDKNVMYVKSSEATKVSGDGSRDHPYTSLDRALESASGRAQAAILLAKGTYTVSRPLILRTDATIVGNLDPSTWQPVSSPPTSRTSIAGVQSIAGTALIDVRGGQILLRDLSLSREAPGSAPLILVGGGHLAADGLDLSVSMGNAAIVQTGGTLSLSGSKLQALASQGSPSVRNGAILPDRLVLIRGGNGFDIEQCRILPGVGTNTGAVRVEHAKGTIAQSLLEGGSGTAYASALELLSGAEVTVRDSSIAAERATGLGVAISVDSSTLSVLGSTLSAGSPVTQTSDGHSSDGTTSKTALGQSGAIVIHATDSTTTVDHSKIRSMGSQYFVSLFDILSGTTTVTTCLLYGGNSGDSVVGVVQDAHTTWLQNTIHAGSGTHLTAGFQIIGGGDSRFFNNIIILPAAGNEPRSPAHAFLLPGYDGAVQGASGGAKIWTGTIDASGNAFAGWTGLLSSGEASASAWRPIGTRRTEIQTAQELDALGLESATFSRNVSTSSSDGLVARDGIHLAAGSPAIGGGIDLPPELRAVTKTDWTGRKREVGDGSRPDIGAVEHD